MLINSPWSIKELKERNYLVCCYSDKDLYTTKEIKNAINANPDFYQKSVESCESNQSFDYYLVDCDGDGYPVKVKSFKFMSFVTKETYIVTVRDSQYDNYVNLLVKKYKRGEHNPLNDIKVYDEDTFHIDEDFKSSRNRKKALVIKLVVLLFMFVLMALYYIFRR